ncbi:MAG: succinate dehydrogenase, cytochrome b556 subunit [Janthinobacterium lividum]
MADAQSRPGVTLHPRPLSPHLSVYRPMLTMVMSILHRITGIALYAGTLLLAWYLVAAASGPKAFAFAAGIMSSWLGLIVLFGFTWALFNHLLGGVRHFIWDAGFGMDHPEREYLAQATLGGGIVLTVLVWVLAFLVR